MGKKTVSLADRIRQYAERYRHWFDTEGTRVGPAGTDQKHWHIIRQATPLQLENAGGYIRRLLRLGCFRNDAEHLIRQYESGGGKALWAELIRNLRARANLSYTFDLEKTFDEDCRLVGEALEQEALEKQSQEGNGKRRKGHAGAHAVPTVDEDEARVLDWLDKEYPQVRVQADIEAATRITRKTVGQILKRLMKNDLACHPRGKKKGWVITSYGKEYVEKHLS